jgi:DNA-binding NarL/FixJ family response regulator
MTNQKTRIFIAEDYPLFIDAIRTKINQEPDEFEFVGYAKDGVETLEILEKTPVDILILDIGMPKMNGLEVMQHLTKTQSKIKVLVLTMYDDFNHIREMLQAGANGYILKNTSGQYVIDALRKIRDGEEYLQNEVAQVGAKISLMPSSSSNPQITIKEIVKSITHFEAEILRLLAEDYSAKEIAEKTFVSIKTVETRKKNLMIKVQAKSEKGLVRFGVENGFVDKK